MSRPSPARRASEHGDVRLMDASNVEQYCRWKGPHFIGSERADALGIEHGDEVEVVLLSDGKGGYTKGSYVHNHTRGVRYTFVRAKTGCLSVVAALALVAAAPVVAAIWMAL